MREARVLRGYTQHVLARAAGISQSAIASYESGRCGSSRAMLRLARVLHVRVEWLASGQGPREPQAAAMLQEPASPALSAAQLPARDRAILEHVLRAYLQACADWPAMPPPPEEPPPN
ncbi:MAG: helix-turn-helix domain-containing protein [Bordetella trematum]|nr:helix-turn-helix transcriptional regulator [Bordetella trematum]